MNMFKKLFFGVIVSMTFFASAEATVTNMYICDSCTNTQYKNMVKSNAPSDELSIAYVLDIEREVVTKWSVINEPGLLTAIKVSVDSTMTENFDKYISAVEDVRVPIIVMPWHPPLDLFDSAYQLIGNPDGLNDLYDGFKDQYSWAGWSISYFTGLTYEMTTRISSAIGTVEFQFTDGTVLVLKAVDWDPTKLDFRFEYYYAEDENGDVIPVNPGGYTPNEPVGPLVADYIYNNGFQAIDSWGFEFTGWVSGQKYGIACSIDGGGGVCTVIPH